MVAAEAAACGCPPLVARHSGLAEVAAAVAEDYPAHLRHLTSFEPGNAAHLAERLAEILGLPDVDRLALRAGARRAAERRWAWDELARRVLEVAG